ncbi:MAG: dTMP kinase [Patescibacteria group bacterium]
MTEKTLFITLEGGDGAGKSTQIKLLSDWMNKRSISHILTKEPGSSYVAECVKIRELLLNPGNDLATNTELLLFLADRAQHVTKLIKPTLNEGKHVICDRYSDSTRIYQCARGLSRSKVDMLIDFATYGLKPDLTFILDIPVEIGLKRAKAKSAYKEGDRMESAGTKFHEDVRHGFLKLAESITEHRFRVINVAPPKTIEEIHKEIIEHVSKKLWIDEMENENE